MYDFIEFYKYTFKHNPLLLNYVDDEEEEQEEANNIKEPIKKEKVIETKYEDKYLTKFNNFLMNEFTFLESELQEELEEYNRIKLEYETEYTDIYNSTIESLSKINETLKKYSELTNEAEKIQTLLDYFELNMDDEYVPNDQLLSEILEYKESYQFELTELEKNKKSDDDFKSKAHDFIIDKKLNKHIDNYVLECTPMGNIYMRYNNSKKSFEYFSNTSMPYKYLEPVGRKYVMTYLCKPIFVDIHNELKKSEEKYNIEKEKPKPVQTTKQFKNYNDTSALKMYTNKSKKKFALPPQIQSRFQNINKSSEKLFLKEKANRYTWGGFLKDFSPLKKIDKKLTNKKLSMTYANYKQLQQNKK
jgi:hypothetical protein